MKNINRLSEIREYTVNMDNPIVISKELLEEADINPNANISIYLKNGYIVIKPISILGRIPEELLLFYEELGFSRELVEKVLSKYAKEAGGFNALQKKLTEKSKMKW